MNDIARKRSDTGHNRRVDAILRRARDELALRDVVTFSVARVWVVVLAFGAVVYALIANCGIRSRFDHEKTTIADNKVPSE